MTKKNIKDDKKEDEKNIKNDKKEDDYHVFMNEDCFYSDEARRYWSKMCSFHRGYDKRHVCGNPNKCQERLRQAETTEGNHRNFLKRWS